MVETSSEPDAFLRRVKRYRTKVLGPAGLDFSEGRRRIGSHFPQHCLFEAGDRILKFYAASRARNARNTVKTSELLRSRGIATPAIPYADVRYENVKQYGVACIIMDRIEGDPFDTRELQRRGSGLAPLLTRLHSLTCETWGDLTWQPGGADLDLYVQNTARRLLGGIEQWRESAHHSGLEGLDPWLERHRLGEGAGPRGFELVHGDLHESNILQAADGTLHLIDLDFSGYRVFTLDLADAIQRLNPAPPDSSDPEAAVESWEDRARPFLDDYFEQAPPHFPDRWRQFRSTGFMLASLRAYLEGLRLFAAQELRGARKEELRQDLQTRRDRIDAFLRF